MELRFIAMECFVYMASMELEPTKASLAKWLSVRLRIKWLWVRVPLQSLNLQISRLFRARNSWTFRQL